MVLFDSHCHLDFPVFDSRRDEILARCQRQGLRGIVVPAVSRVNWSRLRRVCEKYELLHPALGLHPLFMMQHGENDVAALALALERQRPLALGEIGLDFYHGREDAADQQALFEAQLELAEQFHLPVILHVRKAHDTVLACLRRYKLQGGIVHAFAGSRQQAEHYLALGFKLGLGGAMTHPRARRLRRLASELPLSALVLETDAPDMLPAWQHEGPNTPENIPRYCQLLADLRTLPCEQVATQTSANLRQVLPLPLPA